MQNRKTISKLRLADLTAREPRGQYLFRRRRRRGRLRGAPVTAYIQDQGDDAGHDEGPEEHHSNTHSGVTPPTHVVVIPEHHDHPSFTGTPHGDRRIDSPTEAKDPDHVTSCLGLLTSGGGTNDPARRGDCHVASMLNGEWHLVC